MALHAVSAASSFCCMQNSSSFSLIHSLFTPGLLYKLQLHSEAGKLDIDKENDLHLVKSAIIVSDEKNLCTTL